MRGALASFCAAMLMVSLGTLAVRAEDPGQRIYREGLQPDGSQMEARVSGDVRLRGPAAACEACHRRSGYGLTDSEVVAPPITGDILFNDRDAPRSDLLRGLYQEVHAPSSWAAARVSKVRPAYTDATLQRALHDGVDPAGRRLSRAMPRYDLDAAAVVALIGYLKTLGQAPDPGVGTETIRFATVVAGSVDPLREQAMLEVMNGFVAQHNLETARERARPDYSLLYKSEYRSSLRTWALDVWRITGDAATWGAQLDRLYGRQPVFAEIGGLADGDWRPIHDFCEREHVPCLFPAADLPVVDTPSNETLYFSTGLPGEAAALADWLVSQHQAGRVVQVFRRGEPGERLAELFAAVTASAGAGIAESQPLAAESVLSNDDWQSLIHQQDTTAVIVWLRGNDAAWRTLTALDDRPVYASGGLLGGQPPFEGLPRRLRMTFRGALPGDVVPQIYRIRAWLESRHVRGGDEALQLDTYFTMNIIEHALTQMVDHFSRPYLIECIEQEAENGLNPGTYPRLSLGPHQRFASKGDYVVEIGPGGELRQISPWIIPTGLKTPAVP